MREFMNENLGFMEQLRESWYGSLQIVSLFLFFLFFFLCIQHPTLIRGAQDFCFTMLELREGWCWILRKVCATIESYRLSMTSRIMKAIPLMYALRKFPGTLAPQRMSRIHWHIFMTITRAEFIHVLVSRRFWSIPKRAAFILVYKLCTYVYCS